MFKEKAHANHFKASAKGDGRRASPQEKGQIEMAKRKKIIRFSGMTTKELERHLAESRGKRLPERARKKK